MGATSSVIGPRRFETNANDFPAGATAGANSPIGSFVITNGLPPEAGTTATSFEPMTSDPYSNALPSGVQAGCMRYSDSSVLHEHRRAAAERTRPDPPGP